MLGAVAPATLLRSAWCLVGHLLDCILQGSEGEGLESVRHVVVDLAEGVVHVVDLLLLAVGWVVGNAVHEVFLHWHVPVLGGDNNIGNSRIPASTEVTDEFRDQLKSSIHFKI